VEQNTEKSLENVKFSEVFANLSKDQLRFVVAMQEYNSKKEAAKELKIKIGTIYNWPPIVDEAIKLLAMDMVQSVRQMRKSALAKAIAIKIAGLDSTDEKVRQSVSTEIIEAELGKPSASADMMKNETQQINEVFSLPANSISGSFYDVYRDISNHGHVEYVFKGGRGSTKSSFTSEVIIELIINNPEWHALVTRQVKDTLRDSVYSQLVWAINYLSLADKFKCTTNPLEIKYISTGQTIYFRGGDDPLKIKSIKPKFGFINILWNEELDQFRGPEAVRSIVQSAIRGGDAAYIFKSFNPPRSRNNWVNKELEIPKPNRYIHESNYLTVPPEWLGKTFIDEAEFLKEVNLKAYEHEYLGIATGEGGLVFANVEIRKITEDEISQFDNVLHGLDFGYFPDPADYVKMQYNPAQLTLYIYGEIRKWKTSNRALYDELVEYGLTHEDTVICDSAEPKSIADLREYGMAARGAEKGPESVKYSMKWLQSLRSIIIDNERAPYAAEEFLNYEHEIDKDGNYISDYPRKNDHSIASVRYGTNLIWKRRGQ